VTLTPALERVSGNLQAPTALHGGEKSSVSNEVPKNKVWFYRASSGWSL